MKKRIAAWLIRFAVAAAIYATISIVWINAATGWGRLGMFVAVLAFAAMAVPAWCATIAIGHLIANATVRLLVHPMLTTLLFLAFALVVGWFMETSLPSLWKDLQPFVVLVAAATIADAAAGLLLERWVAARPRPAS